jgi:outer membrane receptor protein involved in Fe transport
VRLAAGLSLQLASKLEGTGAASGLDASFDPSLGLVLQAQWVWRLGAERRWRLDLGGRFTWQALRVSTDQQFTTEANAFGIVFGAAY